MPLRGTKKGKRAKVKNENFKIGGGYLISYFRGTCKKPNSGTKKTDFKNESSFKVVILRGVISAFYRPTSVDRKKS